MTSSNGTISALLALCAGNSPVIGEFPSKKASDAELWYFFDLHMNKWLSKQSINRDAGDLRHHAVYYDVIVVFASVLTVVI